jgi:hypothetical protein
LRRKVAKQLKGGHSSITNGRKFLHGVDQRSPWIRRCKDIIAGLLSDKGGIENTSAGEQILIKRCGVLTTECERLEKKFATTEPTFEQVHMYQSIVNSLRRTLESIGLERRPRNVGGTFGELMLEDIRVQSERAQRETDQVESLP